MSPEFVGIVGFFVLLFLMVIGLPISVSMAIVGFVGFGLVAGFTSALRIIPLDMFSSIASYNLSVVSMFTLMGFFALHAGIGNRLYECAYKFFGHLPGGLAIASEGACAGFGAVCGSGPATVATIGSIALPEMKRYKYQDSLATATVAAGGGLGLLIPPSTTAIIYGILTEQSIGRLFIAGISAGILLMLLYMAAIFIMTMRNPGLAPRGPKFTWKERMSSLRGGLLETIIIFAVSVGGLSIGWFTPTEGGAIGAFSVLFVALARRQLSWRKFTAALSDTAKTIGMAIFLVAAATLFGRFIAISKIPATIAAGMMGMDVPPYMAMLLILFIYLVAGCFIDALPLIMLTVPIFFPIVLFLGYDPIWFGVIIVLVCVMGMITPPVGVNVYVAKAVAVNVSVETVFKGVWPFVLCQIVCILFCFFFPGFVLFLPNLLM